MTNCVLISGGVDSALAAALIKRDNNNCVGVYLKIWLEDELSFLGQCPWKDDLSYVEQLCAKLKIPLQIVNLQREYHEHIVQYTLQSVKNGLTPNPDVLCNFKVKFGAFLENHGKDFHSVATGHYARSQIRADGVHLLTSADRIKDQTYFLAMLDQQQLSKARFPIGHLTKLEVREMAKSLDLPQHNRPDSQGLCFLGKIKFSEFVKFHLGSKTGPLIEHETGKIVGQHNGHYFFTVGQRHGLGLSGGPWYVVCKDHTQNTVFISKSYFENKTRNQVYFNQFRTIVPNWPTTPGSGPWTTNVKLRHGPEFVGATIKFNPDKTSGVAMLENNDQGIAPGQFIVFYDPEKTECVAIAQISEEKKLQ